MPCRALWWTRELLADRGRPGCRPTGGAGRPGAPNRTDSIPHRQPDPDLPPRRAAGGPSGSARSGGAGGRRQRWDRRQRSGRRGLALDHGGWRRRVLDRLELILDVLADRVVDVSAAEREVDRVVDAGVDDQLG